MRGADDFIALADEELALRMSAAIESLLTVSAPEIEGVEEELEALAVETFERFAPDAARAELIAWHHRTSLGGDDQEELTAQLDGLRSRQATRMLRDAVGSEGGASHG